jgi:hypothetical protein
MAWVAQYHLRLSNARRNIGSGSEESLKRLEQRAGLLDLSVRSDASWVSGTVAAAHRKLLSRLYKDGGESDRIINRLDAYTRLIYT